MGLAVAPPRRKIGARWGPEGARRIQRLLDILLALVFGLLALPLILGIMLVLWWREGGPIFYGSERMRGLTQGFTLWKFRTMRSVDEDSGVSGGDKHARVTPTGHWLRARRLDELPQLWNILRGDIGFVGPRPPLREYVERFPELYGEVLKSRPGVTGLATLVYHRTEAKLLQATHDSVETDAIYSRRCVPRKAQLDLIYQRNRSICFDLKLILRTANGILHPEPAKKDAGKTG